MPQSGTYRPPSTVGKFPVTEAKNSTLTPQARQELETDILQALAGYQNTPVNGLYYGAALFNLMHQNGLAFRLAETYDQVIPRAQELLSNEFSPKLAQLVAQHQTMTPQQLQAIANARTENSWIANALLRGGPHEVLQTARLSNVAELALKPKVEQPLAFNINNTIYLYQDQRNEHNADPAIVGALSAKGIAFNTFRDRPPLIRHEIAHTVDNAGKTITAHQGLFSQDIAFKAAVMQDVAALGVPKTKLDNAGYPYTTKLLPLQSVGTTVYLDLSRPPRINASSFYTNLKNNLPLSAEDDSAFGEVFAEVFAALYGGHPKFIEQLIFLHTGDFQQYQNTTPQNFLDAYFPHTRDYIRDHVLPTIEKHYGTHSIPFMPR